jgi:hypothetical protein
MKRSRKNLFPYRNVTISWNPDEESMIRYAYKELWPIHLKIKKKDVGRSIYCHAANSFFILFLEWAKANNKTPPTEFFEKLYANNYDVDVALSQLKEMYRSMSNDKIDSYASGVRGGTAIGSGTPQEDSGVVQPGPILDNSGHERQPEDQTPTNGDDRLPGEV